MVQTEDVDIYLLIYIFIATTGSQALTQKYYVSFTHNNIYRPNLPD